LKSKLSILLSTLIVLLLVISCTRSLEKELIGEWEGKDYKDRAASFIFSENRQVKLIKDSIVLEGSWRVDNSRNPIALDIIVQRTANETDTFLMIIRFITKDKIQLRMSDDKNARPQEFSTVDERLQIVLQRK
jgi:hypothetical protein